MKYMVLTTRHHDGFCLFDSKCSDFTAMKGAAHRDFVKEYVEACRKEGMKVGFYYSPLDWRFPGYFMPDLYWESAEALKKQCHDQLMELMSNYGKIDLLWFDGEWLALGGMDWNGERGWYRKDDWQTSEYMRVNYFWESEKLINEIRQLQPDIMINNRGGWEGDFHVRERRIDGMRDGQAVGQQRLYCGFLGLYSGQTSAAVAPADSESGFNRRAGRQLSVEYRPGRNGKNG